MLGFDLDTYGPPEPSTALATYYPMQMQSIGRPPLTTEKTQGLVLVVGKPGTPKGLPEGKQQKLLAVLRGLNLLENGIKWIKKRKGVPKPYLLKQICPTQQAKKLGTYMQNAVVKNSKRGWHSLVDTAPLSLSFKRLRSALKKQLKHQEIYFFKLYLVYLKKLINDPGNLPLPFVITKLNRSIISWKRDIYLRTLPEMQTGGVNQFHTDDLKKYKNKTKYLESYKKKQQSQYLNFYISKLLWKQAKKRHPTKSNRWLFEKYWTFMFIPEQP